LTSGTLTSGTVTSGTVTSGTFTSGNGGGSTGSGTSGSVVVVGGGNVGRVVSSADFCGGAGDAFDDGAATGRAPGPSGVDCGDLGAGLAPRGADTRTLSQA
jgi:hypothetical protein